MRLLAWLGRRISNLRMAAPKSARTTGFPRVPAVLSRRVERRSITMEPVNGRIPMSPPEKPATLTFAALLLLLTLGGCFYYPAPYHYYSSPAYGGYYAQPYGYGYGYARPYGYGNPYYYGRPYRYYGRPYGYGYMY